MINVMLNAYPNSMGDKLSDTIELLENEVLKNVFDAFYILPSLYHYDLDRGFSVIDYDLNEKYVNKNDIKKLEELNIKLKLDFVLNHASTNSPQFQDLIHNENSIYQDFFINWNQFWQGCGQENEEGVIIPNQQYLDKMFFRKPGLPILTIYKNKKMIPYWNTFYQQINYHIIEDEDFIKENDKNIIKQINQDIINHIFTIDTIEEPYKDYLLSHREYLGQMDLNIKSPIVWEYYNEVLKKISSYNASIVRLDAFAYAPKEIGKANFLNEPETWDLLERVDKLAMKYNLKILPEIHASYYEKKYEIISKKGYLTYDFFLPGLILFAIEKKDAKKLAEWIEEIINNNIHTVNMLGCHDGIPLLDLKGLLKDDEIQWLSDILVSRGGYIKNLEGKKNMYYQVNSTYYSALGEDNKKMLFARALQIFTPGIAQVWYLDLFLGKNNYEALKYGHKEINRTNLTIKEIQSLLKEESVLKQIELLRLKNTHPAFKNSKVKIKYINHILYITHLSNDHKITLKADFNDYSYIIY